jgi:hypothetical protein
VLFVKYSGDQIQEGIGTHGRGRSVFRILFGKPEEKKPLGRRGIRWEDDIKIDLKEMVMKVWTEFMWLRVGNSGWLV